MKYVTPTEFQLMLVRSWMKQGMTKKEAEDLFHELDAVIGDEF